MRTLAFALLLPACAAALTPKDESEIRTAIEEQAKVENQKGSDEIWSERLPLLYRIRTIEPVTIDVATVEADSTRGRYLFILTRTNGRWSIVKRVQMWPQRPSSSPQFWAPGSWGYLN